MATSLADLAGFTARIAHLTESYTELTKTNGSPKADNKVKLNGSVDQSTTDGQSNEASNQPSPILKRSFHQFDGGTKTFKTSSDIAVG